MTRPTRTLPDGSRHPAFKSPQYHYSSTACRGGHAGSAMLLFAQVIPNQRFAGATADYFVVELSSSLSLLKPARPTGNAKSNAPHF
jgi:hypothetical protein